MAVRADGKTSSQPYKATNEGLSHDEHWAVVYSEQTDSQGLCDDTETVNNPADVAADTTSLLRTVPGTTSEASKNSTPSEEVYDQANLGIMQAVLIPGVIPYALSYAFLKVDGDDVLQRQTSHVRVRW